MKGIGLSRDGGELRVRQECGQEGRSSPVPTARMDPSLWLRAGGWSWGADHFSVARTYWREDFLSHRRHGAEQENYMMKS